MRIPGAALSLALDLLFPRRCVHCQVDGSLLCQPCIAGLTPYPRASCARCRVVIRGPGICNRCSARPPALSRMYVSYLFDEIARDAVHGLKYGDLRALSPVIGGLVAGKMLGLKRTADVLVPVPLHPRRQRERGYNQAELMARRAGELTGIPVVTGVLRRSVNVPQQALLSREEREHNVRGAFTASGDAAGLHAMIIDDVATTGSTLNECALALLRAGALRVDAAVFAKEA